MIKSEKEEMDAAIEYCKENMKLDIIHDQIANAFLAGVMWQKNRYHAPDKEYYGG